METLLYYSTEIIYSVIGFNLIVLSGVVAYTLFSRTELDVALDAEKTEYAVYDIKEDDVFFTIFPEGYKWNNKQYEVLGEV